VTPDFIHTDGLSRHRHRPPDRHVTGEVADGRVGAQRLHLIGADFENRGSAQHLLHIGAVPGGDLCKF
jgi:hypothetical protein